MTMLLATLTQINVERAFEVCARKARRSIQLLADIPRSGAFAKDGRYFDFKEGFFEISNWTSSFFTGMALLAYRRNKDEFLLEQVRRLAPSYRRKITEFRMDTMHDLGFLYSLYSVALFKLTGDQQDRSIALQAAAVLAARFDSKGGYIRAWGRMDEVDSDYAGLAIIDCMMNLPLLFWAAEESKDRALSEIAIRHADATLKYFVRADGSVYHSYRFDPASGKPIGGDNYCGRAVESQWARGMTWSIYGFALAFRYARDARYLAAASAIATQFIRNLDMEIVPVWDFRLQQGEPPLRDASAAAIAVCGLQELLRHDPDNEEFATAAEGLLSRLCDEEYLDSSDDSIGILRGAEVGDGVGKARSAYTSWGDYFFTEALATRLNHGSTFW